MLSLLLCSLLFHSAQSFGQLTADRILINGHVIPMTGEKKEEQAVAIKDGRILAVGDNASVLQLAGKSTEVTLLDGKTVLPGFVDAHSHISQVVNLIDIPFLFPSPNGKFDEISEILSTMSTHLDNLEDKESLGFAWGYDELELLERRHPTLAELDTVSRTQPFCIMQIKGDQAVCNSKGLSLLGVHKGTPCPEEGLIEHNKNGELTGLLQGSAVLAIYPHLNVYDTEVVDKALSEAQMMYARNGITTAQEASGNLNAFRLLKSQADREKLMIDINVYPNSNEFDVITELQQPGPNINRLRIAGVKLTGDGSSDSGMNSPIDRLLKLKNNKFLNHQSSVRILDQFSFNEFVEKYYSKHIQIISHSNADRATLMAISAIEGAIDKYGLHDHRTSLIHMKGTEFSQLKLMKKLGIIPSFLALNIYYWGDEYHDRVIGPWKTSNFSPLGWANELELPFTLHTDAPILDPNIIELIASSVDRMSKNGVELGKWHAISTYKAIEAVTVNAAIQSFEETTKGTIEDGKYADMVILDQNPLTTSKNQLRSIKVLETIKEGKTIFSA
ncbi:hypothetical protein A8L45_11975 [Veronia pacifica]|uniref:Amidohydrolase 3 domain-containing protein n=2 Tax=Veronia pacifica TaxID=1080227 RepID=A0A1C3EIK5_9GAMM|nr:hypothetical protein A8L45_11975 [Veronia pacifica]